MKKSVLTAALGAGILSFGIAVAAPKDASDQIKGNAAQMLEILHKANGSSP